MPEPDRDKSVERWLRQMPPAGARAESPACLDAETLARWAEGLLNAPERASAEAHASGCARCQAMLAVMVRTMPVPPPTSPSPIRKWLMMLSPALAAGAAVALWFAVDQRPPPATVDSLTRDERSAGQAPESPRSSAASPTVALDKAAGGSLDQAEPKRELAKRDQEAPKVLADASKEREERAGADTQAANTALARNRTPGERKDGAVPATASPAPPPPSTPLGAVAESVQVAGARSAQGREAPPAAPLQQANQNQSQNQNQTQNQGPSPSQNQSQNQNSPRAAPTAVAERRVDTVTSAGTGRGGAQRNEPVSGFAEERLALRTNAATFDVVSPDAAARWRIVDGRGVQRSLDAGATWTNQYSAEEGTVLTAGAAPTPTVCWLVGRAGAIVLTTDGRAWQRVKFPEPVDLTGVISTDARTATVTTGNGRGFRTTDGGRNWTPR